MTKLREHIERHKIEIYRLAERRGARNLRIFSSVARGEDDLASDVDFLVDLEPDRGLLDLDGLLRIRRNACVTSSNCPHAWWGVNRGPNASNDSPQ